ncbi:MAG: ABC transporter related protein [candidate division TM6 bacterium GW2011_GWF2_43_17]|nr:MAG: ABC transporter related protein [candidate division TM6 bacterium GW2011_GWF2_43_17]HAU30113.1 ABC transporter ATP-binding protein [Candidatus Dependentiae bacterium]
MPVLEVQTLTKSYKSKQVIAPLSFSLQRGEILGILGPNGAGKTTLLSMLLGLLEPTSGSIKYFGVDFEKNKSNILARIGTASAYAQLPAPLTVERNLDIYGRLYGLSKKIRTEQINFLLRQLQIEHLRSQNVQHLSAGEMTRAVIIKAFLHNPELVLLDEPTASLDIEIAAKIRHFILEKQKEQVSCIITSHNMADMTELCDRILVLDKGTIVAEGTPEELVSQMRTCKVKLMAEPHNLQRLIEFAQEHRIPFILLVNEIELEVETLQVAQTLQEITKRGIIFVHLKIQEPSLEDYFLSIAERKAA